jgi:phosphatidylglycerophosphate synthase
MLDGALRGPKDRILAPLVRAAGGANPFALTLLGFVAGLGAAAAIVLGSTAAAIALWVVNRLLDGIDGAVARRQGRASDLGGYVDILLDMFIYAAIPIAAAVAAPDAQGLWLALAALLGAFYLNAGSWMYLAAILEKRGAASTGTRATAVTFPAGLIEGTETMILFTLFLLLPGHLAMLFWVGAVLVLVTAGQRLLWATRNL